VVAIDPLNVVPAGSVYSNWEDDEDKVKEGSVTAAAKKVIPEINNRAIKTLKVTNFIFIFPLW
jgi:hypothetical protein